MDTSAASGFWLQGVSLLITHVHLEDPIQGAFIISNTKRCFTRHPIVVTLRTTYGADLLALKVVEPS